jgi:hypothetical protein
MEFKGRRILKALKNNQNTYNFSLIEKGVTEKLEFFLILT